MANYLISYDLRKPGRNYATLHDAIRAYGTWAHVHESVWIVSSHLGVAHVRDDLAKHIDTSDTLLVIECVMTNWASSNLSQDRVSWLKDRAA